MHSTRERLSTYWGQIKNFLFYPIEEEVGSLTNKQQQLITALEVIRIEDFIERHEGVGRPPEDRRRICGWEKARDVPEEWTFSRAFAEFSAAELPTKVHEALIIEFQSERLIGHISRDSTAIDAREKALKKPKKQKKAPRKRGRPKER